MRLKLEVDASARRLLGFLEQNREEEIVEFPFSHCFPRNCCESASLILIYLIEEKYGLDNVVLIKGTKPRKHEHHLWVSVDTWLYDLTAHQFPRRRPIIGAFAHSLFFSFADWKIEHCRDFVDRGTIIDNYRRGVIPF
ncbi:hypothetical protein [Sphingopyxis sp.]|uniref:hypothetical protein n=1 Tax=Sphingopyxis sp. TaxID=1908224 RepID=UPI003D6D2574